MKQPTKELKGAALFYSECIGGSGSYKKGSGLITYTGKEFFPLDPNPQDIDISDIAHALSNICRFTGHTKQFYSVAQHCVIVSQLCEPENAFCGLLHDASEAYLNDIARPVKYTEKMKGYRDIEQGLEKVISKKFEIPYPFPFDVKRADDLILISEGYYLFKPIPKWVINKLQESNLSKPFHTIDFCWNPILAKAEFMKRFLELKGVKFSNATSEETKTEEN